MSIKTQNCSIISLYIVLNASWPARRSGAVGATEPELHNMFSLRKGRRVEQVPLQQITNLAYGPRYLHPSLVISEEMAWIQGFNS